jgi:PilZ domain
MEYEYSRRVPRYSLIADVEVTDVQSGIQIRERTRELALFGCRVDTLKHFPKGTSVKIKVIHEGGEMVALGRVVYARPDIGMGIAFTSVAPEDERILEEWIVGLTSVAIQRQ